MNLPAPGIHRGIDEAIYHSWPAASAHRLAMLDRSPAHLKYAVENRDPPTPSQIVGTALHCAVLQPRVFGYSYLTAPACSAVTAKGKPCSNGAKDKFGGQWLCGVHSKDQTADNHGKTIISAEDYEDVAGMASTIESHQHASAALLRSPVADRELSIVWTDLATKVLCRGRIDALCDDASGLIVDIKTTRDARPQSFERDILNYKYHIQAAMYLRGLAVLGQPRDSYGIIAVENEPPYAVAFYQLNAEALELGDAQANELLKKYAECESTKKYPGYAESINWIGLPTWAVQRELSELNQ